MIQWINSLGWKGALLFLCGVVFLICIAPVFIDHLAKRHGRGLPDPSKEAARTTTPGAAPNPRESERHVDRVWMRELKKKDKS